MSPEGTRAIPRLKSEGFIGQDPSISPFVVRARSVEFHSTRPPNPPA